MSSRRLRAGTLALVRAMALLVLGVSLVACSPSAASRSIPPGTDRIIEIKTDGMHFVPDRIDVKLGAQVAFVVSNPDDIGHELYIGTMADQLVHHARHMAVAAAEQPTVEHGGYGIYLGPHETGVLSYHFDTAGEIILGCHLPGHWEAGMKAIVTVKP